MAKVEGSDIPPVMPEPSSPPEKRPTIRSSR